MTLTELQAEVYTLTNRPDLTAQTLAAVRSATLKLHQLDYFYKDLFETGIVFSTSEFFQSFEYRTLIPRWRALKYLRKFDISVTPGLAGAFFNVLVPENVLDDYFQHKEDVCYVAGSVLQIRSSTSFTNALLGCYLNPVITEAGYDAGNSFIAVEHPYAIIYDAAATVFKTIGKSDESAAYRQLSGQFAQEIITSNVRSTGE